MVKELAEGVNGGYARNEEGIEREREEGVRRRLGIRREDENIQMGEEEKRRKRKTGTVGM